MDEATFTKRLKTLIPGYQSSRDTRDRLSAIVLLAVVGPTSVGKTSLMQLSGIPMVVSDVTRKPRRGEIDGVDNYFRRDFDAIVREIENGEFVQIAVGSEGDFKGTKISRYPESGAATMAITTAAMPVFYRLGFKRVIPVFVVPPSFDEWRRRLQGRRNQENSDLFDRRMDEARQSFASALSDDSYQFVVNDDLRQARDEFIAIKQDEYDQQQSRAARAVAESISQRLEQLHKL